MTLYLAGTKRMNEFYSFYKAETLSYFAFSLDKGPCLCAFVFQFFSSILERARGKRTQHGGCNRGDYLFNLPAT